MEFNTNQKEAIHTIDGNMVVIAAAGSGKTSVLTYRILNMVKNYGIDPTTILAVTFSKKAKESIEQRLGKLGVANVNVETFHSLALKIITSTYGYGKYKVWTASWEKEKALKEICCDLLGLCRNKDDVPYNGILRFLGIQKTNMLGSTDSLIYSDDDPYPDDRMKKIYKMYEDYKKDKSYIEFDDFLNMANQCFDKFPDILKFYQNKYLYVLSDEFQDVSMAQSLLLKRINNKNTMIVGDPLQAIYSFRGGRSEYIMQFDQNYSDVKIVHLNTNYRCSTDIVRIGYAAHAEGMKSYAGGENSHAEGLNTHTKGRSSHAEGADSSAEGEDSHAEGSSTVASQMCAHAEGNSTKASHQNAHAEGNDTTASGPSSHSEGTSTSASGSASHAEGQGTAASGELSHAEGVGTTAEGMCSHAEGSMTYAEGEISHAEGTNSHAVGSVSHAEGTNTLAEGESSHAEGSNTEAKGKYSHASGFCTQATHSCQYAVGCGNDPQADSLFEVGNGLNAEGNLIDDTTTLFDLKTRRNAFRVTNTGYAIAQTALQIGETAITEDQLKQLIQLITNAG